MPRVHASALTVALVMLALAVIAPAPPGEPAPAPPGEPAAGPLPSRVRWKADSSIMVLVPAGPFSMGGGKEANERPRHQVTLGDYYLDRTEVTMGRYLEFCKRTNRKPPVTVLYGGEPVGAALELPAANVTWDDADAYCRWTGRRLPGEAEWEKACAGPEGRTYPWGNGWNGGACVNRTNAGGAAPVGSKPRCQSSRGIMDLSGNVWEWVDDWYKSYPGNQFAFDRTGAEKVVRGGTFFYSIDLLRCSARWNLPPDDASDHGGFRCAVSPGPDLAKQAEPAHGK